MTRRLLASYMSLAALILALLAVPLAITFKRSERQALVNDIERTAITLAQSASETLRVRPKADSLPQMTQLVNQQAPVADERIVVIRRDGRVIFDTGNDDLGEDFRTPGRTELQPALEGRHTIGTRHSNVLDTDILFVAVPVIAREEVLGALRITLTTRTVDGRIQRVWLLLGLLAALVLAVAALLGLRFARSIAGPLARVERASVAAAAGDLSVRAPVTTGPAEVRSLATRFNQMVARVEDLVREREAFVADASHQLRTPLAAMRLRLENLEAESHSDDRASFEAAIAEVDRLDRMVDGLLLLSRPTSDDKSPEPIDVERLVSERVDLWSALADEQGVQVRGEMVAEPEGTPRLTVMGVPGRLEQVIDNLIENALAATSQGSIVIRAGRADGQAEIRVIDSGPGMTDEERARAFDRFWRSERNRSDGTGLGLAIVERLVQADGGTIALHRAAGGGLDVHIRFPVASAAAPAPSPKPLDRL